MTCTVQLQPQQTETNMSNEQFKDLELNEETEILDEEYIQVDDLNIKHEYWRWDWVKAQNFVFLADCLKRSLPFTYQLADK